MDNGSVLSQFFLAMVHAIQGCARPYQKVPEAHRNKQVHKTFSTRKLSYLHFLLYNYSSIELTDENWTKRYTEALCTNAIQTFTMYKVQKMNYNSCTKIVVKMFPIK